MKSNVLPVSRKFYLSLSCRVSDIVKALSPEAPEDMQTRIMLFVDCYLNGGDPDTDCQAQFHSRCRIVFLSLKAEIDRAIARSREARKRAKRRQVAKQKPLAKTFSAVAAVKESSITLTHDHTKPANPNQCRRTRFGLKLAKVEKSRGKTRSHSCVPKKRPYSTL